MSGKAERMRWWKSLGIKEENLKLRDHEQDELSHYSKMTVDIEYKYPFGGGDFGTWRSGGAVEVQLEAGTPPAWRTGLERRGHPTGSPFHVGHAHAIAVDADHLAGASDPRALAEAAAGL